MKAMEPNLQGLPITILTSIVYTLSTSTTKSINSELIQTLQFYNGQQVLPMIWYKYAKGSKRTLASNALPHVGE